SLLERLFTVVEMKQNVSRIDLESDKKYFWFHMLNVSESINALDPSSDESDRLLLMEMETLNEAYLRSFNPEEEFDKYAAMTLLNSIRRFLALRKSSQRYQPFRKRG